MRFYVIVRQNKPKGELDEIRRTLDEEGPQVQGVLGKYGVRVKGFIPSPDASRFMAGEDAPITNGNLESMKRDLENIGYDAEGPFEEISDAARFWRTGEKPDVGGHTDYRRYY
jgi:hypothetical protein